MMIEQILTLDESITDKIYVVRGQKIMLDSDLAELYDVETKVLNQAVNRHPDRFPDDFMYTLSEDEWSNLKSQFVTSSWGGRRKLPKVFTEHGVLMLSSVLNSNRAIQVNIQLVRIFTRLRQMLAQHNEIRMEIEKIKNKLNDQDKNTEIIFRYLDELSERIPQIPDPTPRKRIGFKQDEE